MVSSLADNCAVCGKTTETRCSACNDRQALFCGLKCQKLAWPVHKVFCKAGGRFVYPPLDSIEVAALDFASREILLDPRRGFVETMHGRVARMTGYEGSWQDLLAELSNDDCSIPEPTRTGALVALRGRLGAAMPLPPGADQHQPLTFWQYTTGVDRIFWAKSFGDAGDKNPNPALWDHARDYLEQSALAACINFAWKDGECDVALVVAVLDRVDALFDEMDGLSSEFRTEHKRFLFNSKRHTLSGGKDCPCCGPDQPQQP